jgi:ABC-type polysaccharide/polyol phosphate export permease
VNSIVRFLPSLVTMITLTCGLAAIEAARTGNFDWALRLILLATIFFSGFTLSIERFLPGFRWVSLLLPATYGVWMLRDVMLRGVIEIPMLLVVLVGFAVLLGALGWLGVRRRIAQA